MAAHIDVLVRSLDAGRLAPVAMANVESVRIRMDARKSKTIIQMATSEIASPPTAVAVQARAADTGPFSALIGGGETSEFTWDKIGQSAKITSNNPVPDDISPATAVELLTTLIAGRANPANIELGNLQTLHGVNRFSSLGDALTVEALAPILSAASDFEDMLERMELLQMGMWHLLSFGHSQGGLQVQHNHVLRPLTEVYTGGGLTVLDISEARLTADTGIMPAVRHNRGQAWKERDAVALWLDAENKRRLVRLSEKYAGTFGDIEGAVLVDYEWESEESAELAATLGIAGARASATHRSIEYYAQSNADVAALSTAAYAIDANRLYYRIDGIDVDLDSFRDSRASWGRIGLQLAYLGYQSRTDT